MKQLYAKELLKSDVVVREPIDDFSKKINDTKSNRIIISGGRGTGKSAVLYHNSLQSLGTAEQTIFMSFDAISTFPREFNKVFNEKFITHFYEIKFCWKLLNFIKTNYSLIYGIVFKKYEDQLSNITKKTYEYINNSVFSDTSFYSYMTEMHLSQNILHDIKVHLGIKYINLSIDRFDWIHGGYENIQNIICKFFPMFDKVIVTTDDEFLQIKSNRTNLIEKGYSFIDVNYGQNILVIKEIIRKRIRKYNENKKETDLYFSEDIITDEIYKSLIEQTNGNISCILNCVYEVINDMEWEKDHFDLIESVNKQSQKQLQKIIELKQMDATPPKLHL